MTNIDTVELYFETFGFSDEDIEVNPGVYVLSINSEKFVTKTIQCLRFHSGNNNFRPYWDLLLLYYNKVKYIERSLKQ